MPKKTIVYVDALNLFNGAIKPSRDSDRLPRKFRWLDIRALLMKTLSSYDCEIVGIKYFSALVKGEDYAAHDAYIRALRLAQSARRAAAGRLLGRDGSAEHTGASAA